MLLVQFIAHTLIIVLMLGISLANYWFTFGLWPISWTAFVICAMSNVILMGLSAAVTAAGRKS